MRCARCQSVDSEVDQFRLGKHRNGILGEACRKEKYKLSMKMARQRQNIACLSTSRRGFDAFFTRKNLGVDREVPEGKYYSSLCERVYGMSSSLARQRVAANGYRTVKDFIMVSDHWWC